MTEQLKIECGVADRRGARVVIATLGDKSHRDKLDCDSQFTRQKFREAVIRKFGLPDDAHAAIEEQLIAAADEQDERRRSSGKPIR